MIFVLCKGLYQAGSCKRRAMPPGLAQPATLQIAHQSSTRARAKKLNTQNAGATQLLPGLAGADLIFQQVWWSTFHAALHQHYTGVSYLPPGQPAGKYLLNKISKSGPGHHSGYSVGQGTNTSPGPPCDGVRAKALPGPALHAKKCTPMLLLGQSAMQQQETLSLSLLLEKCKHSEEYVLYRRPAGFYSLETRTTNNTL